MDDKSKGIILVHRLWSIIRHPIPLLPFCFYYLLAILRTIHRRVYGDA